MHEKLEMYFLVSTPNRRILIKEFGMFCIFLEMKLLAPNPCAPHNS